jgi:hypothetical protein
MGQQIELAESSNALHVSGRAIGVAEDFSFFQQKVPGQFVSSA